MRKELIQITSAIVLTYASSSVCAVGIGVHASTLGLGVESTQSLHKNVNTRIGFNTFSIEENGEQDGVEYKGDLNLQSVSAYIDWHPFAGKFRVSGGLLLNQTTLDLDSTPSQTSYEIGDETYVSNDLRVKGEVGFQPITPYLGIGWGVAPSANRGWGLSAELGVVYMGESDIKLSATGTATRQGDPDGITIDVGSDAQFRESLTQEEHTLEEKFNDYVFYPVISLGFMYVF